MTLATLALLAGLIAGQTVPPVEAIKGSATWFDAPSSKDAAAGPLLREFLGKDWRGQWVEVCAESCVRVHLTDWCLCSKDRRLVDLDARAFAKLAPLGRGVLEVVVTPVDVRLPATDCAPEGC